MSIQSTINQGLGTVALGVGMWAHSPGGKKYLETKRLKKEIQQRQAAYDVMPEGPEGSTAQMAKDTFYERTRQLEEKLGQLAPSDKSLSGGEETAAQREVSIHEERAEEVKAEVKAQKEAEERDIQNIRHQEFLNKVLSGTPSEYILQQQKGGTK